MAELILDILNLLMKYIPLITSLLIIVGIVLICSKSIKKKTYIYYIILSIPTLLAIVQYISQLSGNGLDLYKMSIIGDVMRINIYMLPLGLPLLLIIMFTGALNTKSYLAKKLLPIRKELSILCGFPVLTHALFRVSFTFPNSFKKLFLSPEQPLAEGRIYAEIGYMIGIFMTVIFLVLWITSFSRVRRKLGRGQWKKIHRWAYVLYFLIYVHSILLNLGWILGGRTPVASYDRTPEWITEIVSMTLIFLLYIILKIRKSGYSKADLFSENSKNK